MDTSTKPEQQEEKTRTQEATANMEIDAESKKRPSELAIEEDTKVSKKQHVEPATANDKPHEEKGTPAATTPEASSSSGDKKQVSSSRDVNDPDSKPFGGRILTDEANVFEQNAWDHAEWGEEQEQHALKEIARQQQDPVPQELIETYHAEAADNWNKFYAKNENRFFKDRHWLRIEFPELFQMVEAEAGEKNVMEIGCGAGNTMFPLLNESKNPKLFVYACDFSSTAVKVVQTHKLYDEKRGKAFVWDLASDDIPPEVEPESMDVLVLIFVFSALHPEKWDQAVKNLYKLLKPGGLIVFRDYGRYDMAQLRFKKNRLLSDNFYVRGDGTRVYFFESEQLVQLFGSKFTIEQNAVDRRLIVNRMRKVKMYRCWLQAKFRKPLEGQLPSAPSATTVKTTGDDDDTIKDTVVDTSFSLDTPSDSPGVGSSSSGALGGGDKQEKEEASS
ncbi:hypothetical protein KI688_002635 [Linnemannia hyalina]|uniref:Methyltransferase type 12 domain-containing protein n=1 Tax=Linnemannia hyalina TaxID=64524 RepID=A0A9P7XT88_9FUNG|nr:hypothetical protein KI688_002635 [Linnemannia hyalina]